MSLQGFRRAAKRLTSIILTLRRAPPARYYTKADGFNNVTVDTVTVRPLNTNIRTVLGNLTECCHNKSQCCFGTKEAIIPDTTLYKYSQSPARAISTFKITQYSKIIKFKDT